MGEMKRAIASEQREAQKMDRFASTLVIAAAIIAARLRAAQLSRIADSFATLDFTSLAGIKLQ
jgi:hypothetical protein